MRPTLFQGISKFRAVANSVLSPANRQYRAEQAKRAADAKDRQKRRIVIGGQAFSVDDDDLSVTQVEVDENDRPSMKLESGDQGPMLNTFLAVNT